MRVSSNVIKTVKQTCTGIVGAGLLVAMGFWPSFGGSPRPPDLRVFPGLASGGQGLVGICADTHGDGMDDMLL